MRHPAIVFFQTGANDYVSLKGTAAEKVAACMDYKKQMFAEIHKQLPVAKLVVMSGLLLPGRSEYRELTEEINRALAALCEKNGLPLVCGRIGDDVGRTALCR